MDKILLVFFFKVFLIAAVGAHYLPHDSPHPNCKQHNKPMPKFDTETIDRRLEEAMDHPEELGSPYSASDDERDKPLELDILLTKPQIEALYPSDRTKRNALRDVTRRWPNNTLVYSIHPEYFTSEELDVILTAIAIWSNNTCLEFREKTDDDEDYIKIFNGTNGGCYSYVGYVSIGAQSLGLGPRCATQRVLLHELGHSIGLLHEHQRPDKDLYIDVLTENIKPGLEYAFESKEEAKVNDYGTEYDYLSIMHYGRTFFSSNGEDTIRTKDPAFQDLIGRGNFISDLDVQMVNAMYDCPTETTAASSSEAATSTSTTTATTSAAITTTVEETTTSLGITSESTTSATTTNHVSTNSTTTSSDVSTSSETETTPAPESKTDCRDKWSAVCRWYASNKNCRKNRLIMSKCASTCGRCKQKGRRRNVYGKLWKMARRLQ